jgi:hypothetical protein
LDRVQNHEDGEDIGGKRDIDKEVAQNKRQNRRAAVIESDSGPRQYQKEDEAKTKDRR